MKCQFCHNHLLSLLEEQDTILKHYTSMLIEVYT
jgi:hypothetical protein